MCIFAFRNYLEIFSHLYRINKAFTNISISQNHKGFIFHKINEKAIGKFFAITLLYSAGNISVLHFQSSPLLNRLQTQQKTAQVFVPLPPVQDLIGPSGSCLAQPQLLQPLESQPVDGDLCLFLSKANKIFKKKEVILYFQ